MSSIIIGSMSLFVHVIYSSAGLHCYSRGGEEKIAQPDKTTSMKMMIGRWNFDVGEDGEHNGVGLVGVSNVFVTQDN